MSKETSGGSGRTIDLASPSPGKDDSGKDAKDATQAKSSAATPPPRLKAPTKGATETSAASTKASPREASTAKSHTSSKDKAPQDKGLADDVLTLVSQQKFEGQEEKLKDVARHAMSSLRDFQKLSESEYTKKVLEIRKALMKYEMQYIRVWELQDRLRRAEMEDSQATSERLHSEAESANAEMAQLTAVLEKEKQRKRRYEGHEAAAADINKKRTRTELQTDIDAKTAEIEQLRRQNLELKEQAEQIQQRAQLLREAAGDMQQLLATQMQSPAAVAPAGSTASSSTRKAAALIEVIS